MFFSPNINLYFTKICNCERGKRMRKMDSNEQKALDYYNLEDNHNWFKGKVYFPTIQCVKLVNVLCKNEEDVQRYLNDYYSPKYEKWEIINSLLSFKKDLLSERTDVSEYKEKIKECIEVGNWKFLWVVLQELFLEYISREQMNDIEELIHRGINEEHIIKWFEKGRKIVAMTTFGVDYIKSVVNN
jgi:hypothetical protein